MKQVENLHKIVKEMVDLTSSEDLNANGNLSEESLKMPELALVMAKYFNSLGKYCLSFYNSYDKKQKSDKKPKQTNKQSKADAPPRRPITAYITYYQQNVPVFQQKYPNYSISELTRLIAKQWSDLTEQEKSPYTMKAANDRKRYQQEREQYKAKNKLKKDDADSEQQRLEQIIYEDEQVGTVKQVEMQQKQESIQKEDQL